MIPCGPVTRERQDLESTLLALSDAASRPPRHDDDLGATRPPRHDDDLGATRPPRLAASHDGPGSDDTIAAARTLGPGGGVDETIVRTDLSFSAPLSRGPAPDITQASARTQIAPVIETRGRGPRPPDTVLAPADPLEAALARGRIGRFMLLRELGRGAMGVVLAAYDEELDRKVAIKLLHASRGVDASQGQTMLLREAQAMAKLAHPHVVAVHEVGVVAGSVFVAMEYVAGVDLQRWLADKPRTWRDVVAALRQAGLGLVAAHREGLVHRDFKPTNVLVGDDGRVRVADFGLAARRGASRGPAGPAPAAPTAMTATLAPDGALVGTPLYMAPELLRGGSATAKTDQFAFCVALYEALFGRRPFEGHDLESVTAAVERGELPPAPPRPEVPTWLYAAVCRGLSRDPDRRFASLEELVDLLARDPEAERQQRRRRALQLAAAIAGTAALVALLVFGYGAMRRWSGERQAEGRLLALREEIAALQARGEHDEAARLLRSFVALPDNRGLPVVARAYNEWAAGLPDHAAAVDAHASAYITARDPADERVALRGLVDRLAAQGKIAGASAALTVLARLAPDEARGPDLQPVRLAAALWQRDLPAARAVLAGGDEDGWSPVLERLSRKTDLPLARFGGALGLERGDTSVFDFDGDGDDEVVAWSGGATLAVFEATPGLAPVRAVELDDAKEIRAIPAVVPGEPLVLASFPKDPPLYDVRLLQLTPDGRTQTLDAWVDSFAIHPHAVDLDRDGRREIYLGTEAYTRKFWRLDRAPDGAWSRRTAHVPTEEAGSDLTTVVALDFEADGRPELAVLAGPWRAYDVRIFAPKPDGGLDLVARKAFGSMPRGIRLRGPGGDLLAFYKDDHQIAPDRFPPDQPLGEPTGFYLVGLAGRALDVRGFLPRTEALYPRVGRLHAGDLDGDGQDELVVDLREQGTLLLRWRPDQPLRPLVLAGVRTALVHDLDRDGKADLLVHPTDAPDRVYVLGAGDDALPPLPPRDVAPRPVPLALADPAIATAWDHAEQMVALGLPRRAAGELSEIARLSGQVAPDMLLRTAEIYAGIGDDAAAAEHFVAAAGRPDLADRALAGASAAHQRLGEFAAAEALTRQRLPVVDADARPAVEAELRALQAATAARPELTLGFTRPLDPRWRILDPVAVRRSLSRGALSVWTSPSPALAELPLEWDGGPAALEVELEIDRIEWGTELALQLVWPDGQTWLTTAVSGRGLSDHTEPRLTISEHKESDGHEASTKAGSTLRARIMVYPEFSVKIRELAGDETKRIVGPTGSPSRTPPPGPLVLRITCDLIEPSYVSHLWIRQIRLTGFRLADGSTDATSPARLLAEDERLAALAALGAPAPGSEQHLWRLDALLGLGRIDAAAAELRRLLAAVTPEQPGYRALLQRLRRGDEAGWLAARAAFGPQLVDLVLHSAEVKLRPQDIERVLTDLAPTDPTANPADPLDLQRLALTDYTRGLALVHAGRYPAAREAFAAAYARTTAGRPFPAQDLLHNKLLREQLAVAVAMADREAALHWIRRTLERSKTPYLVLERQRSNAALTQLVGPETWDALTAELQATRP